MTSMRRNDVASTSFRHHVPTRFLINQCQIITFLILKYDIIENSRIKLRGIVLPVQVGGLLGGQRVCCPPPPLKLLGGPDPPLPAPMNTIHETWRLRSNREGLGEPIIPWLPEEKTKSLSNINLQVSLMYLFNFVYPNNKLGLSD